MRHYINRPIREPEDVDKFVQQIEEYRSSLNHESYSLRKENGTVFEVSREDFIQKLREVQQDQDAPVQGAWAEITFSGGVPREMGCDLDRLTEFSEEDRGSEETVPAGVCAADPGELPF